MERGGSVYIITNKNNTVLYTGVTSDLLSRVHKHKIKEFKRSFTAKYNCEKLVFVEGFHTIEEAISREKQIKPWSRKKKMELIETVNPNWRDLFPDYLEG